MYLIFDESGDWGDTTDRFFVIGGLITPNYLRVRAVMKKTISAVCKQFPRLRKCKELKASDMPPVAKDYVLRRLAKENIKIVYIVADKNHIPRGNRSGIGQNRFYNYQLGILATYLRNGINMPVMNFILDQRSIKVGSLNSFEDYLSIKLNYEECLPTDVSVDYRLSHNYPELQAADFICNALWGRENYPQTDCFSTSIWSKVSCRLTFPKSMFGK